MIKVSFFFPIQQNFYKIFLILKLLTLAQPCTKQFKFVSSELKTTKKFQLCLF